ncbi:hypothetical protein J4471_00905 [Candidatus Woesearchaeota archaeon]|nr:hypothetical protein [Candidatus Woesearchaeota archaeon]
MNNFDFFIQEEYRGKKINLLKGMSDWSTENIYLLIPRQAYYLDINPLETEEEFLGNQDDSDKQQLNYYKENGKYIITQDLEHQIITCELMRKLERLFQVQ